MAVRLLCFIKLSKDFTLIKIKFMKIVYFFYMKGYNGFIKLDICVYP